jgi:hypothetical protein
MTEKPEILFVLDKWAKEFGYKNWKGLEDDVDADMLELAEVIEIATLTFEQGKLAGSLLSADKSLGKNDVKAIIDILENDWATLQKKNPKIAREMLTHYVDMWNIPVSGYDNKTVIEMIWDGRLSGINASGYWFDHYDKQKSYYVAGRLKSQLSKGEK